MTVVTIVLDDESGEVEMGCRIPGGWRPGSPACQMANMILNHLDTIAERRGDKVTQEEIKAPNVFERPSIVLAS